MPRAARAQINSPDTRHARGVTSCVYGSTTTIRTDVALSGAGPGVADAAGPTAGPPPLALVPTGAGAGVAHCAAVSTNCVALPAPGPAPAAGGRARQHRMARPSALSAQRMALAESRWPERSRGPSRVSSDPLRSGRAPAHRAPPTREGPGAQAEPPGWQML